MSDHPMKPVLDAFQPILDAAEQVKTSKERTDRIYTLAAKLFVERNYASEGQWLVAYTDAEEIIVRGAP